MSDEPEGGGGWGNPPRGTQFKPGQSGNPKGRPRGKREKRRYDVVFDQLVIIRENGIERRVPADEAFLRHLVSKGLVGGGVMARAALAAFQNRPHQTNAVQRTIVYDVYADPGELRASAEKLQIAMLLDPFRPTARLVLEAWAVEAALARLGDRELTVEEQLVVASATRNPHKVRWPAWWTVGKTRT